MSTCQRCPGAPLLLPVQLQAREEPETKVIEAVPTFAIL